MLNSPGHKWDYNQVIKVLKKNYKLCFDNVVNIKKKIFL